MNREEFYDLLDIDTGGDFQYFENVAELFESSEEVSDDLIYELLSELDLEQFGELVENYFDHIEAWIPDGEVEFFTLMTNIERVMLGMIQSLIKNDEDDETDETLLQLADEIGRFRQWYSDTDNVECISDATGEKNVLPVRDALALSKEEKLGGAEYTFDFSDALNYELGDFVMSFADLAELEQ